MKKLLTLALILGTSLSIASDFSVTKTERTMKVVEISASVECVETSDFDLSTDAEFTCKTAQLRNKLSKKLGTIAKIEGLDRISNYVLNNSVEDEKSYSIRARVLFY